MTRGHRPQVAIQEAMHAAGEQGFQVIPLAVEYPLFDFIISSRCLTALVRVRRLRHARYDPKEIRDSCAAEIAELRGIPVFPKITRELWARGPHRGWHRYRIFPAAIEEIVDEDEPDDGDGIPDRSPPENQPVPWNISPDDEPAIGDKASRLSLTTPAASDRSLQAPLAGS
jgi:hypothetical protein